MNGEFSAAPELQLFNCTHADCGATFTRQWRLKEHENGHTGERPIVCTVAGCGRRFARSAHHRRHLLVHTGVKGFKCTFSGCTKDFFSPDCLKKHVSYAHGEKNYFKCNQPNCTQFFKMRRALKIHLKEHGVPVKFKCSKDGCSSTFDSHIARKAHEKKHAGYSCPHAGCKVLEHTWGKLVKHMAKHKVTFTCKQCNSVFKKMDYLRRHKRSHALQKPVLVCPQSECQNYFSTTFNLQHHIRRVHLQVLKHQCSFPDCKRTFAMQESLNRHMLHHDPNITAVKQKRQRAKKPWQKRLKGHQQLPYVEEDLRRLFAMRMRISRRAKVEANLSGLFNERKIPRYVDPEVNLHDLFSIKEQNLLKPVPQEKAK